MSKNEIVNEVIYSIEFWGIVIIAGVLLARFKENYILLSCVCFGLINVFGNDKVHLYDSKLSGFLKKYKHTIKLIILLVLIAAITLSIWFAQAFVSVIVLSIVWKEYMKLFNALKTKSPVL